MKQSIETICVHGGEHRFEDIRESLSVPIYQTAAFGHPDLGHSPDRFYYTRLTNPTRTHLQETVAALEGAHDAIAFTSGMAAIAAAGEDGQHKGADGGNGHQKGFGENAAVCNAPQSLEHNFAADKNVEQSIGSQPHNAFRPDKVQGNKGGKGDQDPGDHPFLMGMAVFMFVFMMMLHWVLLSNN